MPIRLEKWTHHHINRGYHALTFISSVVLVAFFAWILGIALTSVSAQPSSVVSDPINTSAPDIELDLKPEAFSSLPNEDEALVQDPKITVVPGESIQQRYVLQDGEVQPIFVFRDQFPRFIGQTNILDSTAILDVFGENHVTGKSKVDSNGNWSWEPTVPLKPGTYNFNVKATKGQSTKALATDSLLFEIVLDSDQELLAMKFNNIPHLGNGGVLFDVRAVIQSQSKNIKVGDELKVDVKFINFGSPDKTVDVEVQYTITNELDEVVTQNSETMAVSDQLEFSKSFITSNSMPAGEYTLTVAVPSQDLIATATDKFKLTAVEAPVIAETTKQSPFANKPFLLEILGAMVFLGVIIAYMEYNKVIVLSRNIKQINETDLLSSAQT